MTQKEKAILDFLEKAANLCDQNEDEEIAIKEVILCLRTAIRVGRTKEMLYGLEEFCINELTRIQNFREEVSMSEEVFQGLKDAKEGKFSSNPPDLDASKDLVSQLEDLESTSGYPCWYCGEPCKENFCSEKFEKDFRRRNF